MGIGQKVLQCGIGQVAFTSLQVPNRQPFADKTSADQEGGLKWACMGLVRWKDKVEFSPRGVG
ncbi:hypothetical protein Q6247_25690, partial [Klebsiella pneumoniae]